MRKKIVILLTVVLLLAVMSLTLVACNSDDEMDYIQRLYENGYSIQIYAENDAMSSDRRYGCMHIYAYFKTDTGGLYDNITIFIFNNKEGAERLWESRNFEECEDEYFTRYIKDNLVVAGTTNAVKIAGLEL